VSCLIDPDQPAITDVSAVTTTAVTISWSTGNTSVISITDVCYKDLTNGLPSLANCSYNASVSNVLSGMSYTISNLSPGRTYQFYVTVISFSKSSTSRTVQQTTGIHKYMTYCTWHDTRRLILCRSMSQIKIYYNKMDVSKVL